MGNESSFQKTDSFTEEIGNTAVHLSEMIQQNIENAVNAVIREPVEKNQECS